VGSVDESLCQVDLAPVPEILGQPSQESLKDALAHPLLVSTVARLVRRESRGQVCPWGARAKHPEHRIYDRPGVLKRATALPTRWLQFFGRDVPPNHLPLLIRELHPHV
jgi:hypothetical protein